MIKQLSFLLVASSSLLVADATTSVRPYLPYRSQGANLAKLDSGMSNFYHKCAVESVVAPAHKALPTVEPVQAKASVVAKTQEVKKMHVATETPSASFWEKTKTYFKGQPKDLALHTKNGAMEVASVVAPLGHYGVFAVTPSYGRSFDNKKITNALFGWWLQDTNKLHITGSQVASRNEKDLLADWFYLDGNYEGSITFNPLIQNAQADFSMYWGMDDWAKGMYFRIDAPITWSKWDLGACFTTENEGQVNHPTYTNLASSYEFFCKRGIQESTQDETLKHPLNAARFCGCSCDDMKHLTRIADIRMDLGWDFLRRDWGHIGLYVRGVAPTGNRPEGRWLFEPVIGNGHHWELGGGLSASALLWKNAAEDKHISFELDTYATHLFNALQHRVFDLKNMPLSRYMNAFRSNNKEITPVANLTATTINSSFAAQGEILALFNATLKNWTLDLGYNFWAQSCEKINCSTWSNSCYAKGVIKNGYGLDLPDSSKWALSPLSTIHTYVPPISTDVITASEIDYDGARSRGLSHKVFGHIGYAWMDRDVVPFIGVGAEGEFGRNEKTISTCDATPCSRECDDEGSSCNYASLSQWSVWLKGGVSF